MKTSEALELTLAKLWNGRGPYRPTKREYICFAADAAGVLDIVGPIVMVLLGGATTLGEWLTDRGIRGCCYSHKKLQATRKAWLLHLIAHYKSIGD